MSQYVKEHVERVKSVNSFTGSFERKAVEVIVAILTAAITALTTTSCMGYGPL